MKNMIKKFKIRFKKWWKKHIIDYCPPELEDIEFSDKFRK